MFDTVKSGSMVDNTVKPVLRGHSKRTPKIGFKYQLPHNVGQKYCRMLQGEHSALLSTFIKLPFSIKTFVLSIFKWLLKTGFTVYTKCTIVLRVQRIKFPPPPPQKKLYNFSEDRVAERKYFYLSQQGIDPGLLDLQANTLPHCCKSWLFLPQGSRSVSYTKPHDILRHQIGLCLLISTLVVIALKSSLTHYNPSYILYNKTTVLPAKSDSDIMFCLQSYQELRIDRSLVY